MNKIKKGDKVVVLIGKDRGKQGNVEQFFPKKGKVIVPGVNMFKRAVKGRSGIEGGIIDVQKPVDISNVALVCPNCQKPTRVGFEITKDDKKRICKKCHKAIA